jgi:Glycosyltransferase family 87
LRFRAPLLTVLPFRQQAGLRFRFRDKAEIAVFYGKLPVVKNFRAFPVFMTEQPAATARQPSPAPTGWFARLLPAALERDDRALFRDFALLGSALFAVTLIAYAWTIDWSGAIPRDGTTLAVGRDFLNLWMFGRAAGSADPGQFYDLNAYQQAIRDLLGMELNGQNWSYPPSIILLAAPFGQMSYLAALACWTLLGVAVFIAVGRKYVIDWRILIPVVLSPAALFCLISGQSSFLVTAILMAIFALLDRKPVAAGLLIGLLTIKPQLAILFPFMLMASGRWRVFIAAAVTTLALVGVTAAVFGGQVWIDFISKGLPVQGLVLSDPERIATPFFPTVFMNLRGLDLGYAAAMSAQLIFSAFALSAVIWAFRFRRNADPSLLLALFLGCSVSASPYLLAYDLLPLTFAAVVLLAGAGLDAPGRRLVQLVYWTPALQLALGTYHLPGPALIAPAFVAYLLTRLYGSPRPAPARTDTIFQG